MENEQLIDIINLLNVPKIGPQKVLALFSKIQTEDNIFSLSEREICSVEGIDQKSVKAILRYNDFDFGKRLIENTIKSKINILTFWDKDYPQLLKKIYDPPILLFSIGQSLKNQEDAVAIVGTRSATQYGKRYNHLRVSNRNKA